MIGSLPAPYCVFSQCKAYLNRFLKKYWIEWKNLISHANGTRVFLAGDMDDLTGDETRLVPLIGKVDLLKVGHHGCEGSSTPAFLQTLMPKICVFTTGEYSHNVQSRERIRDICGATMYFTARDGGVLALLGSNGDIRCYGQIH